MFCFLKWKTFEIVDKSKSCYLKILLPCAVSLCPLHFCMTILPKKKKKGIGKEVEGFGGSQAQGQTQGHGCPPAPQGPCPGRGKGRHAFLRMGRSGRYQGSSKNTAYRDTMCQIRGAGATQGGSVLSSSSCCLAFPLLGKGRPLGYAPAMHHTGGRKERGSFSPAPPAS